MKIGNIVLIFGVALAFSALLIQMSNNTKEMMVTTLPMMVSALIMGSLGLLSSIYEDNWKFRK